MPLENVFLIAWIASGPLFLYGWLRKLERLQSAAAIVFLLLLIDVFSGLNRPNPDLVKVILITAP